MNLKDYIKDKFIHILMYLVLILVILFLLYMFRVATPLIISVTIVMLVFITGIVIYDYSKKRSFYNNFIDNLKQLDKKYLITEIIERPNFIEGKILYDSLYEIDKSMYEEIEIYKNSINDFKEYIEIWIHEVKLPIASTTLILHNNKPDTNKKIKEQINRIESYVEQVLYFVRSENLEKDYLIRTYNLEEIVNKVIRKNKDSLLLKRISIEIGDINKLILSDSKWLEFVINQIVSNSIKYSKIENAKIKFDSKIIDDFTILEIEDNGIGINEKDINKVFDKSFTGENGRHISNSTGIGLYLVNKLCTKLGHKVTIKSQLDKFTKVSIYFKNDKYYSDVR
ncbi:ATP-binding protein [Romboutsia ilealis]|uniref:ATP-binding protein n=1 Tax=Romboutsia ilealis TaxID=1115758 RepID=UPI00273160AE|nr:ATP-binding protein [Romboutsia ilealis]